MGEISLWSVKYILNQITSNFGLISNLIATSLVGRGPDVVSDTHQGCPTVCRPEFCCEMFVQRRRCFPGWMRPSPTSGPDPAGCWQRHGYLQKYQDENKLTTTVPWHYNAVNFLKNINKRHPIAHLIGRGMGCLLWIQHLLDILPQFLQLLMQYLSTCILDRVIMALDCISGIEAKTTA